MRNNSPTFTFHSFSGDARCQRIVHKVSAKKSLNPYFFLRVILFIIILLLPTVIKKAVAELNPAIINPSSVIPSDEKIFTQSIYGYEEKLKGIPYIYRESLNRN